MGKENPNNDNMQEKETKIRKGSDDDVIAASSEIKFVANNDNDNDGDDVVIVEAKVDHDNAIEESQQKKEQQKNNNDNDKNDETEVREIGIPSVITIKFDTERYLSLKYKKDGFALYQVSICTNTECKTSYNLYLRFSDIDKFNRKLEYLHNRLCKFNADLKQTLVLPQIPTKKYWQRNKLDKAFISERIRLLNIYVNELTEYVKKSSIKIQDLYLEFFQINSLYKYIINNDIEMLSELNKYDNNALNKIDDNKSNIFHYAVSQKSIKCIKWILDNIKDKALIIKLLKSKDQYHWTPLSLSNYLNNNNEDDTTKEIYNLLK